MSVSATANGATVLDLALSMPRTRAWTADVSVELGQLDLSSTVALDVGGVAFRGTGRRTREWAGRTHARVVGGAGGLHKAVEAKAYGACTLAVPLGDALATGGERLSDTVSSAVLGSSLLRWTRLAGSVAEALDALTDALGFVWRVLADGSVWVGTETWPVSTATPDQLDEQANDGRLILAMDRPELRPGTVLESRRLGRITYRWKSNSLRTEAMVEAVDEPLVDRSRGATEALVAKVGAGGMYRALWPAVVKTSGSSTVDVQPENSRIPGLSDVPVRQGLPGVRVEVESGQRVRLGWDDGDPRRPFVALWDASGTLKLGTLLVITNTTVGAVVAIQWFEGSTTGTALATAALAALVPPIVGILVPVTAETVSVS